WSRRPRNCWVHRRSRRVPGQSRPWPLRARKPNRLPPQNSSPQPHAARGCRQSPKSQLTIHPQWQKRTMTHTHTRSRRRRERARTEHRASVWKLQTHAASTATNHTAHPPTRCTLCPHRT
ncbi:unnamed protein product, partial [Ixodes pacificus]